MKLDFRKVELCMANRCISKTEMAEAAGISLGTLNNYLAKRRNPPIHIAGRIAKKLDLPVEEII